MTKVIPIITWTGDNAVALSRTLDTVSDWETVYLYTTETYENTQRVLGNSFKGSGNVVVFTTNNPDTTVSDMKNQGILDVSADWPDAYVIFLEAGDQLGITELCTDDITTDDPVYYGAVAGEYHGKVFEPLYEILEYSLPLSTCGILFNVTWLCSDDNLRFKGDSEFTFLRNVLRKSWTGKAWTIDFEVASGRTHRYCPEIKEILGSISEDDEDYLRVRHLLTRLILDGLTSDESDQVSDYLEFAFPESNF